MAAFRYIFPSRKERSVTVKLQYEEAHLLLDDNRICGLDESLAALNLYPDIEVRLDKNGKMYWIE